MRISARQNCRSLRIILFMTALMMASSLAQGQTNTRGPRIRLKENGKESETYLYKESWALVIGVSHYEQWMELPGVKKDVERVKTALEKQGFTVRSLLNPTRQELKTTIDDFISEHGLDFENRVVVYFAGHGVTLKTPDNREEGYLVMRDTPALSEPDKTNFIQKAAPIRWMEQYAKDIHSKHALFVFDSCFSGKLFEELRSRRGEPPVGELIKPVRQFITAGTANQTVPDKSLFCDYFVKALEGYADANGDDLVTGTELGEYLKRKVTEDSRLSQTPQTPMLGKIADAKLNQGDFIFALAGSAAKVLDVTPSEDHGGATDARSELRERGLSIDVTSVKNALIAVDVEVLKLLTAASLPATVIEEALRQKAGDQASVARRFFENSTKSSEAMKWFAAALAAGVNPNLTVPSDYYEREGLLLEAMRAANIPAIKVLLERGASPHAYQNLFLTRYPLTRFLYPLRFIADDDRLSLEEKQDLTKAFIKAGVVIPKVISPGASGWPSVMYEAKNLKDEDAPKLSMNLPTSQPICEQPENLICKYAGADWCSAIAKMPKKLAFDFTKGSSSPVFDVTLVHLLNIDGNKAYFLGLTRYITYEYVLVEVTKDASSWTVLRYMPPEGGMGLCKKESDGHQPDYCWRRIPLRRVAGSDDMRFEDAGLLWHLTKEDCAAIYPKDALKD